MLQEKNIMRINQNNLIKIVTFFLFSIFFIVGLFTFRDYGMSVDEEFHRASGFYWLNYILSFTPFENLKSYVEELLNAPRGYTVPKVETNLPYGVVFDLPMAFFEAVLKINETKNYYYFRHFINFFLFFISSVYFFKILLKRFSSYQIPLIGTLFYILSPRIYGDSFYNNKDVIFLSLLVIAIYYCFKFFDKNNIKNILLFSLFAGLCTASRVVGVFLIFSFIIFYLINLSNEKDKFYSMKLLTICILSYIVFTIIFWPYLWENPFKNFLLGFNFFSTHYLKIKMLFNGEFIRSDNLPYIYIFQWVFITTPILYLVLFFIGYFKTFKKFFSNIEDIEKQKLVFSFWKNKNEKKDLFILFNISAILFYLIMFKAVLYNGWRHVYFINIFLVYLATVGLDQIDYYLKSKIKIKIHYLVTLLFLGFMVVKMITIHPFQSLYFNKIVSISHEKYEIDYWGISGKKFLDEILVKEKDKEKIIIGVAAFLPLERSLALFDENIKSKFKIVGQDYQDADYIFTNFITDVGKYKKNKYQIPDNFFSVEEFFVDGIKIYEVYKKSN